MSLRKFGIVVASCISLGASTAAIGEEGIRRLAADELLRPAITSLSEVRSTLTAIEFERRALHVADIRSTQDLPGTGAAGDWNCSMSGHAAAILMVRANSYILTRSGQSMAGEYRMEQQQVVVQNGPLKGLGIERGSVIAPQSVGPEQAPRRLEFASPEGTTLRCHEVL